MTVCFPDNIFARSRELSGDPYMRLLDLKILNKNVSVYNDGSNIYFANYTLFDGLGECLVVVYKPRSRSGEYWVFSHAYWIW